MSNMAVGCGNLYFFKLLYNPEPGERKSGIPAAENVRIIFKIHAHN